MGLREDKIEEALTKCLLAARMPPDLGDAAMAALALQRTPPHTCAVAGEVPVAVMSRISKLTESLHEAVGALRVAEIRRQAVVEALKAAGHGIPYEQYEEIAAAKEAVEQERDAAIDRAIKAENSAWEIAQDTHLGTIEGMQERVAEAERALKAQGLDHEETALCAAFWMEKWRVTLERAAKAEQELAAHQCDCEKLAGGALDAQADAERRMYAALVRADDAEKAFARLSEYGTAQALLGAESRLKVAEARAEIAEQERDRALEARVTDAKIIHERATLLLDNDKQRVERAQAIIKRLTRTIERQDLALAGIGSQCMCDGCDHCEYPTSNSFAKGDGCDRDAALGGEKCRACMRPSSAKEPGERQWRACLRAGLEEAIVVWQFHDAPAEYRVLSKHGGDEDWIAFVPAGIDRPSWTYDSSFGCCDVSEHEAAGGTVYIGAHA